MPDTIAALKRRIDIAAQERAALLERRRRAQHDRDAAKEKLAQLGLTPETAEAEIIAEQAALEKEVKKLEKALGL